MADMTPLRSIDNGTAADAIDVDFNFDTIQSYVNTALIKKDGTVAMAAALAMGTFKITGIGDGSAATDAVSKGQMDTAIAARTPYLLAHWTGEQSITTLANVDLNFDTEVYDPSGTGATGANTFTTPAAGLYGFAITAQLDATSAGTDTVSIFSSTAGKAIATGPVFITKAEEATFGFFAYLGNAQAVSFEGYIDDGVGTELLDFAIRVYRLV